MKHDLARQTLRGRLEAELRSSVTGGSRKEQSIVDGTTVSDGSEHVT